MLATVQITPRAAAWGRGLRGPNARGVVERSPLASLTGRANYLDLK